MWHYFVALPLVAWIIGLLGVAVLAAYGFLKRKAIATLASALCDAAGERFWDYAHRKLQAVAKPEPPASVPQPANQKTYKGIFHGYYIYSAGRPIDYCFELEDNGVTTKVPVIKTDLLSSVKTGSFVEIDTELGHYYGFEVVQRVRILRKPK